VPFGCYLLFNAINCRAASLVYMFASLPLLKGIIRSIPNSNVHEALNQWHWPALPLEPVGDVLT
jgi:hypothetical protein